MKRSALLVVTALMAVSLAGGYVPVAHQSVAAAAAAPCEVTPPSVPIVELPQPPSNLRVVGGASAYTFDRTPLRSRPTTFAPDSHDYYLALASRPDCLRAYSLRDPRQLATRANGGYSVKNDTPPAVTYDPQNDPDPRRQDAAKIVIYPSGNNLTNQVRVPIPTHAPHSLFVVWEVWFGAEWTYEMHGIRDQKTWQFGSPLNYIHTEVRMRYAMASNQAPGNVAIIDGRQYNGADSAGPNVMQTGTLEPRVGTFAVQPETWTRLFAYFKAPTAGQTWWEYSLWAADGQTDPVLIYDRLQIKPSLNSTTASWEDFWLEYNTSTTVSESDRPSRPPLVAYARNIVMLKGVADVTPLLQRP